MCGTEAQHNISTAVFVCGYDFIHNGSDRLYMAYIYFIRERKTTDMMCESGRFWGRGLWNVLSGL